ncbi:MAG: histidine triad nucleotide-binding protein [Thiotrichaceae bacterium]|nr:histidine triad nucleotide-binding protein [Thiotrichaceae bacterium]
MSNSTDCIFCKIVAGDIPSEQVYSDDKVIVFKDISPQAPVHLLLIPREHIVSLQDLQEQHKDLMGHMMLLLPKLAEEQGLDGGFRTVINTGADGGQVVYHLHLHLLGGKRYSDF